VEVLSRSNPIIETVLLLTASRLAVALGHAAKRSV